MAPNEALLAWLGEQEIPAAEFARRIDYDRSNFHHILKGRLKPTLQLAHRIEQETAGRIPMSAWAEAA
jgi:hypothetical protein